jgi:hypothetical protein
VDAEGRRGAMTIERCPWWVRTWHRRARAHDLESMWLSLYQRADTVEEARVAWEIFVGQDGQWHWRCPCGQPFRMLCQPMIISVDPEAP